MTNGQKNNSGNREIPVKVVSEFSVSADQLRHQRIAEKAHEIYECRGCCHGRDLDDWLEAERLVLNELASAAQGNAQNSRPGAAAGESVIMTIASRDYGRESRV